MASSGASSFRESRSRSSSVSASRSRSRGSNYRASRSRTSSPSAPSSGDEKLVTIQQANANANGNGRPGPKIAPSQTVRDVKKAIAEELGEELDDDLSLAFGFNWLDDDDRTIESYGVQGGDEVFYVRSATPAKFDLGDVIKTLFFQDFSGKTFHLQDIPLSWAVSTLQNHMAVARGYDPSELRLIWAGKPLESARTLDSYAVPNESTVHIVSRVRGGEL